MPQKKERSILSTRKEKSDTLQTNEGERKEERKEKVSPFVSF